MLADMNTQTWRLDGFSFDFEFFLRGLLQPYADFRILYLLSLISTTAE